MQLGEDGSVGEIARDTSRQKPKNEEARMLGSSRMIASTLLDY